MTDIEQIKPCPFCGGEATKGYYHPAQISCLKCHAGISIPYEVYDYCLHKNEEEYDGYESVYQAIKIWNKRESEASLITTIESQKEEIERLLAIVEKFRPMCCEYETIVGNRCMSCGKIQEGDK